MRSTGLILFAWLVLTTLGCKKSYEGDDYDLSDSKAPYVEFSSKKAITAAQGGTFNTAVQMRTALTEDVTVRYAISGTTGPITGSITIPRNTLKASSSIAIPGGIVAPGGTLQAQLTLVTAMKGSELLRIGFKDPATELITLTITP